MSLLEKYLPDIILAFASPLIIWLFKNYVFESIRNYRYQKHIPFSLGGIWLANHKEYYDQSVNAIEIVKFKQQEESLTLTIELYKSDTPEVQLFMGKGIIKADNVSFFYSSLRDDKVQTGTMILKIKTIRTNTHLSGWFYELCDDAPKTKQPYCADAYHAIRCELTRKEQIHSFFKKTTFKNYDEAEKRFKEIEKNA